MVSNVITIGFELMELQCVGNNHWWGSVDGWASSKTMSYNANVPQDLA